MNEQPLDPSKTILVIKRDSREVGRIAATAPNAEAYIAEIIRSGGNVTVDYIEDELEAQMSRLFSSPRR